MIYSDLFFKELEKENSEAFIQEKNTYYQNTILPFYNKMGEPAEFLGQKDMRISCLYFRAKNPQSKIILVTGYNESHLKYAELIKNLVDMNISVYCYDHRGQGTSERFANQKDRGYVDSFYNLVQDLSAFFRIVSGTDNHELPIYILAHSMGGAVATTAVCDKLIKPHGLILSAPMFEIMLTPWHFLESLVLAIAKFFILFGKKREYAFGQKDCVPFIPFETNDVTHSKFRFFTWRKHISQQKNMQLGGPTFQWIYEAENGARKIRKRGAENLVPTTIFQGEEDTVVRNSAQDSFIKLCPNGNKIVCGHARHEILMEIDFIRDKVLDTIKNLVRS